MKLPKSDAVIRKSIICLVWLLRIAIGGTFIFAGFSKAVDPWGFYYKLEEYLSAWGMTSLPDSAVLCTGVLIAAIEFTLGALLVLGCLRRAVCWGILTFMAVMLPLTGYIAIFSPVDDCGCFGDALILSNSATFFKNLVITLCTVCLLMYNKRAACIINPMTQWMAATASVAYCLILSFIGYSIQPVYDFRPYQTGTSIYEDSADSDVSLIYEKDGSQAEFSPNELPDSTWQYVGRVQSSATNAHTALAIYDGEDDVTDEILTREGPQMLLVVNHPSEHNRARAAVANALSEILQSEEGAFSAIIGAPSDSVSSWKAKARADYDVYYADDSALKELVRGKAALVYLKDGVIQWKRNLYSFSADFPDPKRGVEQLDEVYISDSGDTFKSVTYIYIAVMCAIYILSMIRLRRKQKEKEETGRDNRSKPENVAN